MNKNKNLSFEESVKREQALEVKGKMLDEIMQLIKNRKSTDASWFDTYDSIEKIGQVYDSMDKYGVFDVLKEELVEVVESGIEDNLPFVTPKSNYFDEGYAE